MYLYLHTEHMYQKRVCNNTAGKWDRKCTNIQGPCYQGAKGAFATPPLFLLSHVDLYTVYIALYPWEGYSTLQTLSCFWPLHFLIPSMGPDLLKIVTGLSSQHTCRLRNSNFGPWQIRTSSLELALGTTKTRAEYNQKRCKSSRTRVWRLKMTDTMQYENPQSNTRQYTDLQRLFRSCHPQLSPRKQKVKI